MTRSRRGFTIVELLVVVTVIGVLAQIAIPHYAGVKRRALAASIVGDVRAVQIAAFGYYTEHGEFPAKAGNGKVPDELVDYLPAGFTFKQSDWTYKWHTWNQSTGKGKAKVTESLVGLRVQSSDKDLIAQLAKMGGPGFVPVVTATQVTFMVATAS